MTLLMTACSTQVSGKDVEIVSPVEFQTLMKDDTDAYLLDVRRPDEYATGHLEGAHLLDWLDPGSFKKEADGIDKDKTIYVYCRSGRRSNEAANYLSGKGYKVVDMDGGILAWENEGLPVTTDIPATKQIEDSCDCTDEKIR
ncbi:MAG: rhodanese-like domain-containing protein [Muribaculaceae bacterium]|nr:rhodanese-like domain-containing protein [Muribaculaceae bacterium]